jgi:L-ascorbate metabolism protein UlaG (beta-lactamase superfamily)
VTHTHHDHWDDAAISRVPKHLPLFAQHDADAELIRSQGFTGVSILSKDTVFNGISLVKTPGQHGTDEAYAVARQIMGEVYGIVFRHRDEKTLYVAGDTIWNDYVRSTSPSTSRTLSFSMPVMRKSRALARSSWAQRT